MNFHPRLSLTTPLCLISGLLLAQPTIDWQRCYAGNAEEAPHDIRRVPAGGYIAAGYTTGPNAHTPNGHHGETDMWVLRIDEQSNILWQRYIGGTGYDFGLTVDAAADGGFLVVGYTEGMAGGDFSDCPSNGIDVLVMKLNANGETEWQRCMGGSAHDRINSVKATPDGGFVLVGNSNSTNGDLTANQGSFDAWVVKLDASGTTQWQRSMGGSSGEAFHSVALTTDNGYALLGYTGSSNGDVTSNQGNSDFWVVKLDANGTTVWQRTYGGSASDEGHSIHATSDGGYALAGQTRSNNGDVSGQHGEEDIWLVKIDGSGELEWQRCLGGAGEESNGLVTQLPSGNLVVSGNVSGNGGDVSGYKGGAQDIWLVEVAAGGTLVWQRCLGGSGQDATAGGLTIGNHGGIVLTGMTTSNNGDVSGYNGGWLDVWVVKFAGDGTTGVQAIGTPAFTASPNPANSLITIDFPEGSRAQHLHLFDAMGRSVLQMPVSASSSTIPVDLSKLAPGSYLAEVRFADGAVAIQRIIKH